MEMSNNLKTINLKALQLDEDKALNRSSKKKGKERELCNLCFGINYDQKVVKWGLTTYR